MSKMMIDIENAVVSYREDVALRGVSLKVSSGEFVGIVGPNGAGKTTLLTIVNGLGKLLSGRVAVVGEHFTPNNGHAIRKKVGYVAQVQNIDPRMPLKRSEMVSKGAKAPAPPNEGKPSFSSSSPNELISESHFKNSCLAFIRVSMILSNSGDLTMAAIVISP